MLRSFLRFLSRRVLGAAARAPRQVLDADARLALSPRSLENELQEPSEGPRRVRHLVVYQGGLSRPGVPVADGRNLRRKRLLSAG